MESLFTFAMTKTPFTIAVGVADDANVANALEPLTSEQRTSVLNDPRFAAARGAVLGKCDPLFALGGMIPIYLDVDAEGVVKVRFGKRHRIEADFDDLELFATIMAFAHQRDNDLRNHTLPSLHVATAMTGLLCDHDGLIPRLIGAMKDSPTFDGVLDREPPLARDERATMAGPNEVLSAYYHMIFGVGGVRREFTTVLPSMTEAALRRVGEVEQMAAKFLEEVNRLAAGFVPSVGAEDEGRGLSEVMAAAGKMLASLRHVTYSRQYGAVVVRPLAAATRGLVEKWRHDPFTTKSIVWIQFVRTTEMLETAVALLD